MRNFKIRDLIFCLKQFNKNMTIDSDGELVTVNSDKAFKIIGGKGFDLMVGVSQEPTNKKGVLNLNIQLWQEQEEPEGCDCDGGYAEGLCPYGC